MEPLPSIIAEDLDRTREVRLDRETRLSVPKNPQEFLLEIVVDAVACEKRDRPVSPIDAKILCGISCFVMALSCGSHS